MEFDRKDEIENIIDKVVERLKRRMNGWEGWKIRNFWGWEVKG